MRMPARYFVPMRRQCRTSPKTASCFDNRISICARLGTVTSISSCNPESEISISVAGMLEPSLGKILISTGTWLGYLRSLRRSSTAEPFALSGFGIALFRARDDGSWSPASSVSASIGPSLELSLSIGRSSVVTDYFSRVWTLFEQIAWECWPGAVRVCIVFGNRLRLLFRSTMVENGRWTRGGPRSGLLKSSSSSAWYRAAINLTSGPELSPFPGG